MGTSDFVAKLVRDVGNLGIQYLQLSSEMRASLWDWTRKPVVSHTNSDSISWIELYDTQLVSELVGGGEKPLKKKTYQFPLDRINYPTNKGLPFFDYWFADKKAQLARWSFQVPV